MAVSTGTPRTVYAKLLMRAPGKARPRDRTFHMPPEYAAAKREFDALLKQAWGCPLPKLTGPLELTMTFSYRDGRRPDGDNAQGFLQDALQDSGVIGNDRQIIDWRGAVAQDGQDCIEFWLKRLEVK